MVVCIPNPKLRGCDVRFVLLRNGKGWHYGLGLRIDFKGEYLFDPVFICEFYVCGVCTIYERFSLRLI